MMNINTPTKPHAARPLLAAVLLLLLCNLMPATSATAQTGRQVKMPKGKNISRTETVAAGELIRFYDDGGTGNYSRDQKSTLTFNSANGSHMAVFFEKFTMGNRNHKLTIDGGESYTSSENPTPSSQQTQMLSLNSFLTRVEQEQAGKPS